MRVSFLTVLIVAVLLFVFGLTGPLTPSEGLLGYWQGFVFWLVPSVLSAVAGLFGKVKRERIIAAVVFVVIVGFGFWRF